MGRCEAVIHSRDIEIVEFSSQYANAFARLNTEWLEEYFHVEPIDGEILSDPQRHIIDSGGAILFARQGNEVIGTVALRRQGDGVYELTKMAVTRLSQGRGVGRLLLRSAIEMYSKLGGKYLYLESHSSLKVALALYEAFGFAHSARPSPSDYDRSDVYMVYRPD